jgi:aminopeptidase-like protein
VQQQKMNLFQSRFGTLKVVLDLYSSVKKLKESDWINQHYKNKMAHIQTRECYRNVDFQKKTVHAMSYEVILLVIIAIALSFIFNMP